MVPFALLAAQAIAPVDASDPSTTTTEATTSDISVRAVAGVGAGDFGPAARIGLQDEFWFARQIGFGVAAGATVQSRLFGSDSDLLFAAPSLSFRSTADGSWWLVGLSAGYAYREDEFHRLTAEPRCSGRRLRAAAERVIVRHRVVKHLP